MYHLKTTAAFDSAHFLAGYEGKCANIHGHRWVIEVEISGADLQESGTQRDMLLDFGDIKKAVRTLADFYDHALIYEMGSLRDKTLTALQEEGFRLIELPSRPTAEYFARLFFETLREQGLPVTQTTVYETPDNCAVYHVS
ncbi:MAG: 6-carboxytetrahydropterin synthase QueD [Acutalibacteraceae bacterium]|nr:6-carboxytetrahydropterin synthase QueD [Clostridia bacterium]MEE3403676.1 6-carboxytetrahydropterin synthase QueD [Acutalibacteraceae bacterium]